MDVPLIDPLTRHSPRRFIHFLQCGAAALCLFAAPAYAVSSTQQLFLQAEAQKDPAKAAELWKQVLAKPDIASLGDGITADTIRQHLVQSLLKVKDPDAVLPEARQVADTIMDANTKAWALMAVAREAQEEGRPDVASQARISAGNMLKTLSTGQQQSSAAYGMVVTLMRGGAAFEDEARRWLPYIQGRQHALALREIAIRHHKEESSETLVETAEEALDDETFPQALSAALALPLEPKDTRQKLLFAIHEQAKDADQFLIALDAIAGMESDDRQTEPMLEWVEDLVEEGQQQRAIQVARLIGEPGDAARAWGKLAKYYEEHRQEERLDYAWEQMQAAWSLLTQPARKSDIAAEMAKIYAETGNTDRARAMLEQAGDSKKITAARLALVKAMTRAGELDKAAELLEDISASEEDLVKPVGELAKAYARQGKIDEAQELLEDYDTLKGDAIDKARKEIARQLAKRKEMSDAEDLLNEMTVPSIRRDTQAMLYVLAYQQDKKKPLSSEMQRLLSEAEGDEKALAGLLVYAVALDMVGEAEAHFATLKDPVQKGRVASALGIYYVDHDVTKIVPLMNAIAGARARDKAISRVAAVLAQHHMTPYATRITRYIKDMMIRVKTFRTIAETQARYTDFYGMLKEKSEPLSLEVNQGESIISPRDLPARKASPREAQAFEQRMLELESKRSTDILMTKMPSSAVGRYIPKLSRLSRLSVDTEYVHSKLPAMRLPFHYSIMDYRFSPYNEKFVDTLGFAGFHEAQETFSPNVIYIQSGVVTLPALYDRLILDGHEEYLQKKGTVYTLRAPIIIGPRASLSIEGPSVSELRMSTERRSYIVNTGKLFILETKVFGWREQYDTFAKAVYEEKYHFRPYITSWSRSHTYMAGSEFISLGYSGSKSYGISLTSGPKQLVKNQIDEAARPRAVITENSFRNMLYGFYSYEADHVVLVGNEYVKNIVYGIDPHDRSRWFTIAYNTAYDTGKKHGIIISREVNFSTILGNISFDNIGSGIMIDRQSSGTLIYANSAYTNKQDGLTIFESSCKIIASNRFFDNGSSGIRVRNSTDVGIFFNVLRDNKGSGIHGYTADLTTDPAHAHRDFELDPFSDVVAFNAVGNWVEANGTGINADNIAAMTLKGNQFVHQSPKLLRGEWTQEIPDLLTRYDMLNDGVFLARRCPGGVIRKHEPCSFRASGYFRGDGQIGLIDRIEDKVCKKRGAKS